MAIAKPSFDLTGKVAIITGSTRGIGNAIAKAYAASGASVVITGRKQEVCDAVAEEIKAAGYSAIGVATSVDNAESRANLVAKTVEAFGRIDILVNNAGVGGTPKNMVDMDEAFYDNIMNADLKAVYFMSQLVAKQMAAQGRPEGVDPYRIINMSSAAGIKSPRGDTVYGSAKAAVTHLTRIMANELARYGITCNTIAPGYVLTDMTKDQMANEANAKAVQKMISLRRYAMPEEMASVATFVASPAAGYMTGVLIPVDGGMTIN